MRAGQVRRMTRNPNTARPYGFHHSGSDAYRYTWTTGARIMPSGRSKSFWTLELSWQAMKERMCYDRNA